MMGVKRVSKDDLLGVFYVKKPDGTKRESYFNTLDALRPLFKDKEFNEMVKGFYLNICGNFDSVRISYFIDRENSGKTEFTFKQFFRENEILEIKDSEYPKEIVLAKWYGGEEYEERFRNFLVLETQIGLELIDADLLNARILFATYRWQVRKASLSFKEHFEPAFKTHSPTYNSLSDNEKDQFFTDLEEWPNSFQVDWAHFMVNLVLPGDWIQKFSASEFMNYLTPRKPLSILEINKKLSTCKMGFQIPLDWKP